MTNSKNKVEPTSNGSNNAKLHGRRRVTTYEAKIIRDHNAKMKIIHDTAKANGLSGALLYYAAQFGIMGIPWIINR